MSQAADEMKFLGIEDKEATYHYAYMTGGVMYHKPGEAGYWTDLGTFLQLRSEGKIVAIRKHEHYDPVVGGGPTQVYGFPK